MRAVGEKREASSRKQEAGNKAQGLLSGLKPWSLGSAICHLSFVVFPLALLWKPLFAGEAFFWGTPLLQFVPWQRMATAMWREGHVPLWNPLVGCGAPLAANYQTAAFYPLNLLYLLLPAEVALSWTTALHLVLAGWGMYRWGRVRGLDRLPAFIGAMALEGGAFLVTRVALFPSMAFTFPWVAVWLWRAELLVQRGWLRDGLWLGLTLGLGLLAGHAQTAFYGGALLAAYLVFRTLCITHHVSHCWILILCALGIGVGLAAIQLLPTAELMLSSQRSMGVDYDSAMTYSFWPWRLITFVAPGFFGNPGNGDYWGYPNYWEGAGYVGVLSLLLAVEAVGSRKRGSKDAGARHIWFWVIAAVVGLLLALGKNTPVFKFLFHYVPSFALFQAPARWLAVVNVALAVLASWGAQWWPVGRRGKRRGALGVISGLALLISGLAAPRIVDDMPATFGPATARLGIAMLVAGALALMRRDAAWWRAAVGGFVVLDLLAFGWPLVPTVDRSLYHGGTEVAAYLRGEPNPVRVYWPVDPTEPNSEYGAEYRVKFSYLTFDTFGPRDVGHWWEMREALLPDAGMLDGVGSVNNFDPLLVGWYVELLDAAIDAPSLLRTMGATHVVSDRPWSDGEPVHAIRPTTVTLYRLPDALGRAWVVPAARRVPLDDMVAVLANPAFDPSVEVLLEQSVFPDQRLVTGIEYQVVLQDIPNGVMLHVNLDAPGYLVLADTWYPGWRATVDGERVELLRANYAFRAISLNAGAHVVEMLYHPLSVRLGAAMSLGTLIAVAMGGLVGRLRGSSLERWSLV